MQQITVEELINFKILPFNIYTKDDKLLFPAGEVLTPGKFLQLRHIDLIYRNPNEEKFQTYSFQEVETTNSYAGFKPIVKDTGKIDSIDYRNITTEINKLSTIPAEEQIKLKVFFDNTLADITKITTNELLPRFQEITNKIQNDYAQLLDKAVYSSQMRLMGEYEKCHAINVAILTSALARKLGKPDDFVADVTMAALLHDIGKICIPETSAYKQGMTIKEQKLYQAHTKIGYNLIKNKLNLSDKIARVALEHHEHNDGTGYPSGKSGDFISLESQIISVCNYFDNLTFNKTPHKIYNAKDALRVMLEMGSKNFAIDVLYTFIYMYNYDDTKPFEEMMLT